MSITLPIYNLIIRRIFCRKAGPKLVVSGSDQDWSKDCKRLRSSVFCGPGLVFLSFRKQVDWSRSQSVRFGQKNQTGSDFKALYILELQYVFCQFKYQLSNLILLTCSHLPEASSWPNPRLSYSVWNSKIQGNIEDKTQSLNNRLY